MGSSIASLFCVFDLVGWAACFGYCGGCFVCWRFLCIQLSIVGFLFFAVCTCCDCGVACSFVVGFCDFGWFGVIACRLVLLMHDCLVWTSIWCVSGLVSGFDGGCDCCCLLRLFCGGFGVARCGFFGVALVSGFLIVVGVLGDCASGFAVWWFWMLRSGLLCCWLLWFLGFAV